MFSAIVLASTAVMALPVRGPSTGGGGFVVACPATVLGPAKTELLDLYEAKANLPFVLATASGNISNDYFASVQRVYGLQGYPQLAEERKTQILENLNKFFLSTKFVEPSQLPTSDDLGVKPWIPSTCAIQQVAFFDDASETIYMRRDLFDQLDSLNQAALVQHELWYRDLRTLKDSTSQLARLAVAHTAALRGIVPVKDGVVEQSKRYSASNIGFVPSVNGSSSTNEVSEFYLTSIAEGVMRLQFTAIQGRAQLTKTWIDVPEVKWDLKLGRSTINPQFVGCLVQNPNHYMETVTPIQGSMVSGLSIRLISRTGEPVTLDLIRNGEILSTGQVYGCSSK